MLPPFNLATETTIQRIYGLLDRRVDPCPNHSIPVNRLPRREYYNYWAFDVSKSL